MIKIIYFLFISYFFDQAHCQFCYCDLTLGCDVNCCCDPNCGENNTLIFSSCIDTNTNLTSFSCVYDNTVYINNTETTMQVQQDGLFCVVTDNYANRNVFVDPSCAATNTCFNDLDSTFDFKEFPTNQFAGATYQIGDALIVTYDSIDSGLFTIPSSGITSNCVSTAVEFLNEQSNSCVQHLGNLANLCSSLFNYRTYWEGFRLIATPESSSLLLSLNISVNECIVDGVEGNCSESMFQNGVCLSAVVSVSYSIFVNDLLNEISSVSVSFVLKDLVEVDFPLTLTSFVTYHLINMSSVEKAGNPGYIVGKPLLPAVREQVGDTVQNIYQSSVLGLKLSLINPSGSGLCSDAQSLPRLPILFDQDRQTGCNLRVGTDCTELSRLIKNLLDGALFDAFNGTGVTFVGTYGNSNISNLLNFVATDWVQVVNGNNYPIPISQIDGCNNMVLSSQFEVLYANSGALSNPQPKVVGVRYSYGDPKFIKFGCFDSSCVQMVGIFTSVKYIDVSVFATSIERQQIIPLARLPSDFYHPIAN